jgi:hypothetical protein
MLRSRSILLLLFIALTVSALSQSMAPGVGHSAKPKQTSTALAPADASSTAAITLPPPPPPPPGDAASSSAPETPTTPSVDPNDACTNGVYTNQRWWLPLNFKSHTEKDVQCFFNTSGPVLPITQANFAYGFGSSASTISVDMISQQFSPGFQISIGSSIAGQAPSSSSSSNGSTPPTSQTTPGQETTAQAIQQLQNGGDFYVRGIYPLLYGTNNNQKLSGFVAAVPRLGFNIAGMTAQSTLTESTEYNWNISAEAYGQIQAIGNTGFVYGDIKTGYQYIQPDFATSVGLGPKNNFLLSTVAAGVQFNGFARIGFQYSRGPAQLSSIGQNDFNKFHLVIQLSPTAIVKAAVGAGAAPAH